MEKSGRDYHLEHSFDRTARAGRDHSGAGRDSSVPREPEVFLRGDRHDAGNDWHPNSGQLAALAEIIKIGVAEEELDADIVSARVDLSFEIVKFTDTVRGAGMTRTSVQGFVQTSENKKPPFSASSSTTLRRPSRTGQQSPVARRAPAYQTPPSHVLLRPSHTPLCQVTALAPRERSAYLYASKSKISQATMIMCKFSRHANRMDAWILKYEDRDGASAKIQHVFTLLCVWPDDDAGVVMLRGGVVSSLGLRCPESLCSRFMAVASA